MEENGNEGQLQDGAASEQQEHVDQQGDDSGRQETFDAEYVRKLRAEAARHRSEAKANAEAAKRLAELEAANATDLEKAVAKAQQETRAQVAREYGEQLAKGLLVAQLSARMKPADAEALVGDLNVGKFVGEDGVVDQDSIAKVVARLSPKGGVDLGQGGRGEGPTLDQQIAEATKRGDTREAIRLTNQKLIQASAPK